MSTEAMARRGDSILATVPMRRLGLADEIAQAVVFLCSDRSAFMTGTAMPVDGGYTTV